MRGLSGSSTYFVIPNRNSEASSQIHEKSRNVPRGKEISSDRHSIQSFDNVELLIHFQQKCVSN